MGEIDVEEERRLAGDFHAETKGPFVDNPRPISELAQEYERGHETYKKKIENLSAKFPWWRRLKGDGSCGFRALVFGLFETVLEQNDAALLEQVTQRISQRWTNLQIDELYEMWVEEITDLSSRLQNTMATGGDAKAHLVREFNEDTNQKNYIQFLRTLVATWMRAHKDLYQASLDEDLEMWCHEHVDLPDAEIEYVSLAAAYAVLFSDFGITIKIHHLDLSPGSEANVHTLSPDSEGAEPLKGNPSFSPIWLLYRPGHYDLVYSSEPVLKEDRVPSNPEIRVPTNAEWLQSRSESQK